MGGPPSHALFFEFPPVFLLHIDTVFFRSSRDPFPGGIALGVGHSFHLIEAGYCVADVSCVMDGLFAFFRESEVSIVDMIAGGFFDLGHAYSAANE